MTGKTKISKDNEILRGLGGQIAEIAALPVQKETIGLWKKLNSLHPARPMFTIDQVCWHEMDVDGELTNRTEDPFSRTVETDLRRRLYSWKHMRADMVVEPYIDIPKTIYGAGNLLTPVEQTAVYDPDNSIVGHRYIDQLQTEDDLEKIKAPVVILDDIATAQAEERAHEIFDGIIGVRMQGISTMFNTWDDIVQWHGVENTLIDLVDRPEFMHAIISRVTDDKLSMLDQLEAKGLLEYGQRVIHCSGAYSNELPSWSSDKPGKGGFNPEYSKAGSVWTAGMAQIFATVSPAMHKEFDLDYANKWYERFGLVNYGCCEPLHMKVDIIRQIPHLRKISMSPWANQEIGAEKIGRDFVFLRKPSPAFLAGETWDPQAVEEDLVKTMEICRRYGCTLEFNLKDISTVHYRPQRLWQWADIAAKLVNS